MNQSLVKAAVAAQCGWAEADLAELDFLTDAQKAVLGSQLTPAAQHVGSARATRFLPVVGVMATWGGVLMAALVGAAVWAAQIPTRHAGAGVTAAAYLLVAVSATVGIAVGGREFLAYLRRFGDRPRRFFLRLWTALLTGFAAIYITVDSYALARAEHRHSHPFTVSGEFTAFLELAVVGLVLGLLAAAAVQVAALRRSAAEPAVSWVGHLLLGIGGDRYGGERPLDEAMLGLVGAAAGAAGMAAGTRRADQRSIKGLIVELEVAATHAQRFATTRVPRLDFATRRAADRDGARLAGMIRDLKSTLARAFRPSDFAKVATTAARLLTAWADDTGGGLAELLASAPEVRRPSWWQQLRGRVGNAALLAVAGLALPELPIYAHDHAAALGARYTLLTSAVFALITGSTPVWDTVSGVLDKAVPETEPATDSTSVTTGRVKAF